MKSPSEKYYVFLFRDKVRVFGMESSDIDAIILVIHIAKRWGFEARVSANAVAKIREFQREATREWN